MRAKTASLASNSERKRVSNGVKPGERRGGRKKGTPNKATADVKAMAQKWGPGAIKGLAKLAGLTEAAGAVSEAARVSALTTILDRAYGRATQTIAGDPDNPLQTVQEVRITLVKPGE